MAEDAISPGGNAQLNTPAGCGISNQTSSEIRSIMVDTIDADRRAVHSPIQRLLLVDDDAPFRRRLQGTLERYGFVVTGATNLSDARRVLLALDPTHAIVDLRLPDGNGLDLVAELDARHPHIRIIVLTGFGNLATAVAAVKAGAADYLAKPADPLDVIKALEALPGMRAAPPTNPMSGEAIRWEHIQRLLSDNGGNISETARRLKMHRRTLQRTLSKVGETKLQYGRTE